jgi:protein TonB
MHTIDANQTIQNAPPVMFNPLLTAPTSYLRLGICIFSGAVVTFLLFAGMHTLIAQDIQGVTQAEHVTFVSSILNIEEETTIKRLKPEPLPEVKVRPARTIEIETGPDDETAFSPVVSIPSLRSDNLTFKINELDQQPRPIVRVDPRYPATAATNGIEGFVTLTFKVAASGEVIDIVIIESEPRRVFDSAAKQALRKWRYQPKLVSGSPVGMDGLQVRLDFTLAQD